MFPPCSMPSFSMLYSLSWRLWEEKDRAFEAHQWLITMNGIYIHENLDVEQLAADRVYEFAYIFSPLRLKGATGSPGNPIAVV